MLYRTFSFTVIVLLFCLKTFADTPPGFKIGDPRGLPVLQMPSINKDSILLQDSIRDLSGSYPFRFGYNHSLSVSPATHGRWINMPGYGRVWQLGIHCPGASSINLAFRSFELPVGAKLYLYSADKQIVFGPYTHEQNYADKEFGTDLIGSESVVLEYVEPATAFGQVPFELFRLTHGYRGYTDFSKALGDAGNCHNNVNCPQYSQYNPQKRSVVCLVSNGNEFCTGALVNNTANDGRPYVLTANHCGTAGGTWVFRFNWEAPACTNPSTNPSSQSITGAVRRANSAGSDFQLAEMNSRPPANYNVYYAGWSRSTTAATSAYCIHHPSGDIKKISFANNATVTGTYSGAQCWRVGQWTSGVTEPGSSGSPLFDQNNRIIGQLYGGPSTCTATGTNLTDYYGRFNVSWTGGGTNATRLSNWLDPSGTNVTVLDGYDPNAVATNTDAAISNILNPGSITCQSSISVVLTLLNDGLDTLRTADITSTIDGLNASVFNWTGLLAPGRSVQVTLPARTVNVGNRVLSVSVGNPNGGGDNDNTNNSQTLSFTVQNPNAQLLPFSEGFETTTFPPAGWTAQNPDNNNTWFRFTTAGGFGQSASSASISHFDPNLNTTGNLDYIQTPNINFSNAAGASWLAFNVAYARYDPTNSDSLFIRYSTDCGLTWTTIYNRGGTDLSTSGDLTTPFTPSSLQWRRDSINISSINGNSYAAFSFGCKSGWGNNMYLDDINIYAANTPIRNDVRITGVNDPAANICNASVVPSIQVNNNGQLPVAGFEVYYRLNQGVWQLYPYSGSLAVGQTRNITLPAITAAQGANLLEIDLRNPNGQPDTDPSNDSVAVNFTLRAAPSVNLGSDTAVCGSQFVFNAGNAGATYYWSTGAGTQTITVFNSGTYRLTVSNSFGCVAYDTIQLSLNPVPSVVLLLPSDTICSNRLVSLSGGSPAGGIYTGQGVTGATLNTSGISGQNVAINYTYTDQFNCSSSASDQFYVDVCAGLSSTLNPEYRIYPNPSNSTFTIEAGSQIKSLKVFDYTGSLVLELEGSFKQKMIDGSSWSPGTYIFQFIFENGISRTQRVTKSK